MVRKRSDGRWEARIVIGHKNDGTPMHKSVFGKTQKETLDKLHRAIETYRDVDLCEDSRMTLGEWLDKRLDEYMIFTLRESTMQSYRMIVTTISSDSEADNQPTEPKFEPYKGKIRKPGTGCVTMINDHLYEGRYTPTNAYGKRESHNIYAKTREECEEKLAEMITEVKAQIKAEKEKMTG